MVRFVTYCILTSRNFLHAPCGLAYLSRYSDSLRAGRFGNRIPFGGEIFRTRPNQPCGLTRHFTTGFESFPGIKRPERGVNHPPHLELRLKKKYKRIPSIFNDRSTESCICLILLSNGIDVGIGRTCNTMRV
jgi:hypothetical protein